MLDSCRRQMIRGCIIDVMSSQNYKARYQRYDTQKDTKRFLASIARRANPGAQMNMPHWVWVHYCRAEPLEKFSRLLKWICILDRCVSLQATPPFLTDQLQLNPYLCLWDQSQNLPPDIAWQLWNGFCRYPCGEQSWIPDLWNKKSEPCFKHASTTLYSLDYFLANLSSFRLGKVMLYNNCENMHAPAMQWDITSLFSSHVAVTYQRHFINTAVWSSIHYAPIWQDDCIHRRNPRRYQSRNLMESEATVAVILHLRN